MSSVKNLKRDINHTLGDLIEECYVWEMLTPNADKKKSEVIIDEAIVVFDTLITKVHAKEVANKKQHFKAINNELEASAKALVEKINSL